MCWIIDRDNELMIKLCPHYHIGSGLGIGGHGLIGPREMGSLLDGILGVTQQLIG